MKREIKLLMELVAGQQDKIASFNKNHLSSTLV